MNDTQPTPETDDAARKGAYLTHGEYPETCGKQIVHIDFGRRLERERDSAKTLNRSLLDQLEAKDAQIEALRDANATIQAREAELVLSKDRISKRAEAIRCELVEKDEQLAAMREAIKEAREALTGLDQCRIFYGDSMDIDNHVTDACATARANLRPFLKP